MAHKHNRRRARPRSRQNKNRKDSSSNSGYSSYDSAFSYDSFSYLPQLVVTPPEYTYVSNIAYPFNIQYTSSTDHYYKQIQKTLNHNQIAPKDAINVESQRLRMFGGEPGDDIDLCYKMMEVFEGMEWIQP